MKALRLVYVLWEDASVVDEAVWIDRTDHKEALPTVFHQTGFLVSLTKKHLVLTDAYNEKLMGARTRIPRGMVRRIVYLEVPQ